LRIYYTTDPYLKILSISIRRGLTPLIINGQQKQRKNKIRHVYMVSDPTALAPTRRGGNGGIRSRGGDDVDGDFWAGPLPF
jgi:hypothetical protein